MKKLQIQSNGRSDEFYTPENAINCLLPYLDKEHDYIWECAWGKGSLAKHLQKHGFYVIGDDTDFLRSDNTCFKELCTKIVTNPPYSKKLEFLKCCYEIDKPFALLMPLTTLEGKKRGELFRKYGIELIIPNKRINFITPSGSGSGAWFQTAWFCYKFNLPHQLNFVEL